MAGFISGDFSSDGDGFDEYAVGEDLGFDGGVVLREGFCLRDQCGEYRFCGSDVLTVLPEVAFCGVKGKWKMLVD